MTNPDIDPFKISSPAVFVFRMVVFIALVGMLLTLLQRQVLVAFMANPGLNGVIVAVAVIGTLLAFRQVIRLFPEVRWVNTFRQSDPGIAVTRSPVLLAPMAAILGSNARRATISTLTMRSLMDSLGARLEEGRELSRYLTGLLVFLGLLGTFWGLIETVTSVSKVISSLSAGGELGSVFEDMKRGLAEPLGGMGIAFSSSLFGLSGSLVLGFLDLQASQAQNRFYTEIEDFLASTSRDLAIADDGGAGGGDVMAAFERLRQELTDGGSVNARTATALAGLAEGIQGLVSHMRAEQQMVRSFIEEHAADRAEIKTLIASVAKHMGTPPATPPAPPAAPAAPPKED